MVFSVSHMLSGKCITLKAIIPRCRLAVTPFMIATSSAGSCDPVMMQHYLFQLKALAFC